MNKKIIYLILIVLIILGILFRITSINKDFIAEETDFVRPAIAWINTGRPQFYHSEQQPTELSLWHPPMYIYTLSLSLRLIRGEVGARIINITFSILTAALIYIYCTKIIKHKQKKIIALLCTALFLTNFYVLQSSVIIDIDILSMFFITLYIYSITMSIKTNEKKYFYISIISMFFSIYNRYPIAFLVYISIGALHLIKKDLRKQLKKYFYIGVLSFALFLAVWGFYSTYLEPGNFWSFIKHNFEFGGEMMSDSKIFIGSFLLNIAQMIRLVTLPMIILILMSVKHYLKSKSINSKILIHSMIPVALFFIIIPRPAFGYPRYFISIFPAIFILVGVYSYKNIKELKLGFEEKTIIFLSFFLIISTLVILMPNTTIYASNGLIKATNLPDLIINMLATTPLLLVLLTKKQKKQLLILVLIILSITYSTYHSINYVNHESKIKQTGIYLKENTKQTDLLIIPKAIAHYANRSFYVNDNNKPDLNLSGQHLKTYIEKSLENPDMDEEFFYPKGIF